MLPDVMLHIGAPKAGSSAIQRFCQTHRESLADLGFFYPDHPLDRNGVSGGHTQLAGALLQDRRDQAEQCLAEWLEEARQRRSCLLLSAEALYGQHAAMSELTQGLEVRVVGFLRHPVDYLLGNHNQGIKRHMGTQRLGELLPDLLSRPTPHLVGQPFLRWTDVFGDANCRFLPYRAPDRGTPSIEQRFLQALGVAEADARTLAGKTEVTNRGYVKSALELKRLLNTVLPELPEAVAHRVDWSLQGYSDRAVDEQGYTMADLPDEMREMLIRRLLEQMAPVIERFPALQEVADAPVQPAVQGMNAWLDLGAPLQALGKDDPQALARIREVAVAQREAGRCDYAFYKLLDVLGIAFDEPVFVREPLTLAAHRVLANEEAHDADYLREMAVMLERLGFLGDALTVIGHALAKRPKGQGIIRIKARIEEKLSTCRQLQEPQYNQKQEPK